MSAPKIRILNPQAKGAPEFDQSCAAHASAGLNMMVGAHANGNGVREVSEGNKRTKYGFQARRCSNCKKPPPRCPTPEDAKTFWQRNTECPTCGFSGRNINPRSIPSPIGHCASPAPISSETTPQTVHSVMECDEDEDAPSTPARTSAVGEVNGRGDITSPGSKIILNPTRTTSLAQTPRTLKKYKTHGTRQNMHLRFDKQQSTIRRLQKRASQHKVKLARVKAELDRIVNDCNPSELHEAVCGLSTLVSRLHGPRDTEGVDDNVLSLSDYFRGKDNNGIMRTLMQLLREVRWMT